MRNPHVGFVAYVPMGSIEKGKDLVTMGGMRVVNNTIVQGKTTACVTCHGLDLMGVTDIPPNRITPTTSSGKCGTSSRGRGTGRRCS